MPLTDSELQSLIQWKKEASGKIRKEFKDQNKNNGKTSETGLDNGRTVEGSPIDKLVGGSEAGRRIYKTIETSNNTGGTSPILTIEEREELETSGINPIEIIQTLQKIKTMEYQSKNHKQNCQNKTKSIQEWQKSPLTSEEKQKHLESHFQAHNQTNPNNKKTKAMKTVEISEEVNGLKMNFTCNLTEEEYQMYQQAMEQGKTQEEALKMAQQNKMIMETDLFYQK